MTLPTVLALGFIAGATILLGLPVGRIKRPAESLRVLLAASATGVLLFLVWDVLSAAWNPIDALLSDGVMLEDALKKAGVPVEHKMYSGVTHELFGMATVVKKAKEA